MKALIILLFSVNFAVAGIFDLSDINQEDKLKLAEFIIDQNGFEPVPLKTATGEIYIGHNFLITTLSAEIFKEAFKNKNYLSDILLHKRVMTQQDAVRLLSVSQEFEQALYTYNKGIKNWKKLPFYLQASLMHFEVTTSYPLPRKADENIELNNWDFAIKYIWENSIYYFQNRVKKQQIDNEQSEETEQVKKFLLNKEKAKIESLKILKAAFENYHKWLWNISNV